MILEFQIEGLPKILTNARMHWRVRHNENVKWKGFVANAVEHFYLHCEKRYPPLSKAKITLTRYSSNEPDFDGLTSSFKSVLDGLVEAGVIIDDKVSVIGQPIYLWSHTPPRKGKIRVRIESAEVAA